MKLKILNIISEALFFVSSSSLLFIPFLDTDTDGKLSAAAYILAGLFWSGLILGIFMQIILLCVSKKHAKMKGRKIRRVTGYMFLVWAFLLIPVLAFWGDNEYLLTINLFLILLTAETYFVLKRTECL